MKTFVRIVSLIIALGTAGLLAGCAGYRSASASQRRARDFEVVETSSKRVLNDKEMAHLRAAVAKYLEKEGAVASGDYYVKVFLAPDKEGVPAEWVVVRFTRDTEMRFALLGSAPAYSTDYQSYASYDYYPYGYDSFGRISFQYYDDPFYGPRYYYPPQYNSGGNRNHDHDRDHDRDGDKNRNRDHDRDGDRDHSDDRARAHNSPRFNPGASAGSPQATPTRWDNNTPEHNNTPRENASPRHGGGPDRPSERSDRSPERQQQPATISPVRSEASRSMAPRSEPTRSESPARSSYTPPARSESSSSSDSRSSQSQKEAAQAAAQRQRLE